LGWLNGVHLKLACFFGKLSFFFLFVLKTDYLPFSISIFRFKLLLNSSNDSNEDGGGDSEAVIKTKAFERGVLALPGTVFLPNGNKTRMFGHHSV
jgi:hypothetical protein